jgi:putative SOS response-associated peptidase YedK
LSWLHWGLIPSWAKDKTIGHHTINARAETVAEKPTFRASFRKRRCLIPATGFFEWQATNGHKQPYNIRVGDGKLFAFAGLWEHWEPKDQPPIESCTIIVTEANDAVAPIHDRMPVILHPDTYNTWLDPNYREKEALKALLKPCPVHWINAYPVSTHVNKPQNDDAACVARLD